MHADGILSVLSAIVGVAAITAFVASPNTANVLNAGGSVFVNGIRAALGH